MRIDIEVMSNVVISAQVPDTLCYYCKKVAECRPYGSEGRLICFSCGMKPKHKKMIQRNFMRKFGTGKKGRN